MLLNILAEPVTRLLTRKRLTLKRLSTILKMNYKTHQQQQSLQEQSIEFRDVYGIQNSLESRTMQRDLIVEEFKEFMYAATEESYESELKELADLVYVCFQYAENMEWDLETALNRVHESNLSKLGLDNKPIRRSDGKVMKGPNYQPPNLQDLVK
jgi:predicted HAD superfamily Cof-like phosphohydrolase|tara:strand:- start:1074 stop:1538 length:465 start_codon:yes stop_codon:yes gene_type:complete